MDYFGDIRLGDTIDFKFCTVNTSGVPTTLAGTPAVSAYPGNSTTELTAGITLSVDFDSRTGMHNVRVVASSGNGYATATNYILVITAGTVGGSSVVGYVIGSFSIEARSALMPTTAARTLAVDASNKAPATVAAGDIASAAITRAVLAADTGLQSARSNTAQAGAAGTITLDAGASAVDNFYQDDFVIITGGTGVGQGRLVASYVGSTKVATITPNWATNPDNTSTFALIPRGQVDLGLWKTAAPNALTSGRVDSLMGAVTNGVIAAASFASGALDAVWSTATRTLTAFGFSVTVGTNNDKTGYGLSSTAVQAIWDALTSALTTANSIGKLLVDNINATISSRSTLDATAVENAVWDATLASHQNSGSTGEALGDAASAGDPWNTPLPGAYGAGTAGQIVGDFLDAAVSTRADQTSVDNVQTDVDDVQTRLPAALVSGRIDASVGAYQSGQAPLQPTTSGRTLDVSANGNAGLDWNNIDNPGATQNLSATTIKTATDIATQISALNNFDPATTPVIVGTVQATPLGAIADAVWDEQVDGTVTARQSIRLANSANGGKSSGAGTTSFALRDLADTKDRVNATVTLAGNRTAVSRDLT